MSEIEELRAEMARLQERIDSYEEVDDQPVGRRNMLRALGAAGAGAAVGGLAFARPAAAVDPNDVEKEALNNVGSPTALVTQAGYSASPLVGAFHVTNDSSQTNLNLAGSCISAIATGTGGGAQDIAFAGAGSRIGAKLDGPVPLKLGDSTNAGPPGTSGIAGQFRYDDGDLWYCVSTDGGPGDTAIWRQLATKDDPPAAPTPPPTFNFVTPFRVFDSRLDMGAGVPGKIAAGADTVIPCRDARDVITGAVTTANAVPAGALAVTFYVAAIDANNGGFLTVSPSDATEVTAASVNFDTALFAIGSGGVTTFAGDREVKLFAGGPAGTSVHYTLDITGYYTA